MFAGTRSKRDNHRCVSTSITRIAATTKRPDRVIGIHFMKPVPLMKLVEAIKGLATIKETLTSTPELCRVMDK